MPKIVQKYLVEIDDQEPFTVSVDQRDISAWEKHPDHGLDRLQTAVRFMAFNAARRQGLTALTEKAWDGQVVEVSTADDEDQAAEDGTVDPTQAGSTRGRRTSSDTDSSTSPS